MTSSTTKTLLRCEVTDWTWSRFAVDPMPFHLFGFNEHRIGGDVVLSKGRIVDVSGTVEYVPQGKPVSLQMLYTAELANRMHALGYMSLKDAEVVALLTLCQQRDPPPNVDDLVLFLAHHGVSAKHAAVIMDMFVDDSPEGAS